MTSHGNIFINKFQKFDSISINLKREATWTEGLVIIIQSLLSSIVGLCNIMVSVYYCELQYGEDG